MLAKKEKCNAEKNKIIPEKVTRYEEILRYSWDEELDFTK